MGSFGADSAAQFRSVVVQILINLLACLHIETVEKGGCAPLKVVNMMSRHSNESRQTQTIDRANGLPGFEQLLALAKHHPAELEALRVQLSEQIIAEAPEHLKPRLRGLLFTIDMERQLAGSPMASCLKLSGMMNDSLIQLSLVLANPQDYLRTRRQQAAQVIPLFEH